MTDEKVETPRVSDKLLKAYAESTVAEDNGFSKPPVQLMAIELMELRAELERVKGEKDEAKRILRDEQAFAKAIVSNSLKDEMERMRQRATTAEAALEKANKGVRLLQEVFEYETDSTTGPWPQVKEFLDSPSPVKP